MQVSRKVLKKCAKCHIKFLGHPNSKYCRREVEENCRECGEEYSVRCGLKHSSYCSTSCQNKDVSNRPEVKEAKRISPNQGFLDRGAYLSTMAERYGEGVTNPSHLETVKRKRRQQMAEQSASMRRQFQELYGVENPSQVEEFQEKAKASNSVSQRAPKALLARLSKTHPHLKNLEEYVTLDEARWAKDFSNKMGRLPTQEDLREYFNLMKTPKIPLHAKAYFDLTDSKLEASFQNILEVRFGFKLGEDFHRHRRFLIGDETPKGRGLELDFFLPSFMLAFEVQDLATHSKELDFEEGPWGLKKGPSYHSFKKKLAASYGIFLVEVWEEEFEALEYLTLKIKDSIDEARSLITDSRYNEGDFKSLPKDLALRRVQSE